MQLLQLRVLQSLRLLLGGALSLGLMTDTEVSKSFYMHLEQPHGGSIRRCLLNSPPRVNTSLHKLQVRFVIPVRSSKKNQP